MNIGTPLTPSIRMPSFQGTSANAPLEERIANESDHEKSDLPDLSEFKPVDNFEDHIRRRGSSAASVKSNKSVNARSIGVDVGSETLTQGSPLSPIKDKEQEKEIKKSDLGWNSPDVVKASGDSLTNRRLSGDQLLFDEVSLPLGLTLMLVIIDKIPYATSMGISSLFPRWKGKDVLQKMLRLKGRNYPTLTFKQEHHEWFFEKCIV